MFSHVRALYLPRIAETREHVALSIEGLLGKLESHEALLAFLLEYCAMRIGPLQPIPSWLESAAAMAKAAGHAEVGVELSLAAERELEHRRLLIDDLVHLREIWYRRVSERPLGLGGLVRQQPSAAVQEHAALRKDSAGIPLAMIATELELAEFGRVFGPALVGKCGAMLGDDAHACTGFVRARAEDADRRADERLLRLEVLLVRHPKRAAAWSRTASSVIRSYLAALGACAELRPDSPASSVLAGSSMRAASSRPVVSDPRGLSRSGRESAARPR